MRARARMSKGIRKRLRMMARVRIKIRKRTGMMMMRF